MTEKHKQNDHKSTKQQEPLSGSKKTKNKNHSKQNKDTGSDM